MNRARALALGALGVAVLTHASSALAWCRTAGCPEGVGARCEPALPTDCGTPLTWPSACLGYSLQADGTKLTDLDRIRTLVATGFAQWLDADCGGANPGLAVSELDTVACDLREFDTQGANANLVVFRDEAWPYSSRALALTTLTYGLDDAVIRDADIEVNTAGIDFTFDDVSPVYDFQSIITHEIGHFLGLAHSSLCDVNHDDPDCPTEDDLPTMVLSYDRGSTALRTLAPDDAAAICAVYPPGDMGACEPSIEGGLLDECGDGAPPTEDASGCCTVAPGAPPSGRGAAAAVSALFGLAAFAARRRAPRRRPGA